MRLGSGRRRPPVVGPPDPHPHAGRAAGVPRGTPPPRGGRRRGFAGLAAMTPVSRGVWRGCHGPLQCHGRITPPIARPASRSGQLHPTRRNRTPVAGRSPDPHRTHVRPENVECHTACQHQNPRGTGRAYDRQRVSARGPPRALARAVLPRRPSPSPPGVSGVGVPQLAPMLQRGPIFVRLTHGVIHRRERGILGRQGRAALGRCHEGSLSAREPTRSRRAMGPHAARGETLRVSAALGATVPRGRVR